MTNRDKITKLEKPGINIIESRLKSKFKKFKAVNHTNKVYDFIAFKNNTVYLIENKHRHEKYYHYSDMLLEKPKLDALLDAKKKIEMKYSMKVIILYTHTFVNYDKAFKMTKLTEKTLKEKFIEQYQNRHTFKENNDKKRKLITYLKKYKFYK